MKVSATVLKSQALTYPIVYTRAIPIPAALVSDQTRDATRA